MIRTSLRAADGYYHMATKQGSKPQKGRRRYDKQSANICLNCTKSQYGGTEHCWRMGK